MEVAGVDLFDDRVPVGALAALAPFLDRDSTEDGVASAEGRLERALLRRDELALDLADGCAATYSDGGPVGSAGALSRGLAATPAQIDAVLTVAKLCANFGTPTSEALDAVLGYAMLADASRETYILLVTDGASSCASPADSARALALRDPVIETFAVGFGDEVDTGELAAVAQAGETQTAYQVEDLASVKAAFGDVAARARACSFVLDRSPSDVGTMQVTIDGAPVDSGLWSFDASRNIVALEGPACDRVRAQAHAAVDVAECATVIE